VRLLTIEMAALRPFHLGLSPAVQAVAPAARPGWLADHRWQVPAEAGPAEDVSMSHTQPSRA
jgi:hypothetical protein